MATSRDLTDWQKIQYDPTLRTQQVQESAVLRVAAPLTMSGHSVEIPRHLSGIVGGGSVLVEDTTDGSKVTMYSYQYNNKVQMDEADTEDAYIDAINAYDFQFLNRLAVVHDNACLGVTGARSTVPTDNRPYNSLIKVLRTDDTDAGYAADDNVISGALTYDNLSNLLGILEDSDFGDPSQLVVIGHRGLRNNLRKIKDSQNNPIFQDAAANVLDETLFGAPIVWTQGAVESSQYNAMSASNPKLLFIVNRSAIVNGQRIEPQSRFIPASINTTELAHTLQHRARRGFVVTIPNAASVLRVTS